MRSTFLNIEAKANRLTGCHEYQQQTPDKFAEKTIPCKQLEIEVFVVIIVNILSASGQGLKAKN